ncbi:hypothetical protein AVL50_05915 [Flammeovirga sp. SJP92]|nr:hypothetical protein AVL50_05915 [Flammeovirga sp. SJP92]
MVLSVLLFVSCEKDLLPTDNETIVADTIHHVSYDTVTTIHHDTIRTVVYDSIYVLVNDTIYHKVTSDTSLVVFYPGTYKVGGYKLSISEDGLQFMYDTSNIGTVLCASNYLEVIDHNRIYVSYDTYWKRYKDINGDGRQDDDDVEYLLKDLYQFSQIITFTKNNVINVINDELIEPYNHIAGSIFMYYNKNAEPLFDLDDSLVEEVRVSLESNSTRTDFMYNDLVYNEELNIFQYSINNYVKAEVNTIITDNHRVTQNIHFYVEDEHNYTVELKYEIGEIILDRNDIIFNFYNPSSYCPVISDKIDYTFKDKEGNSIAADILPVLNFNSLESKMKVDLTGKPYVLQFGISLPVE